MNQESSDPTCRVGTDHQRIDPSATAGGRFSAPLAGLVLCLFVALGVSAFLRVGTYGDLAGLAVGIVAGGYYTWRRLHPHPRTLPGHCRKCGYDLTGNQSGTCPECGTKVESI